MWKKLKALRDDQRGTSSIEYAFTLALIFLAVLGAWGAMGDELSNLYTNHSKAMKDARKDGANP